MADGDQDGGQQRQGGQGLHQHANNQQEQVDQQQGCVAVGDEVGEQGNHLLRQLGNGDDVAKAVGAADDEQHGHRGQDGLIQNAGQVLQAQVAGDKAQDRRKQRLRPKPRSGCRRRSGYRPG